MFDCNDKTLYFNRSEWNRTRNGTVNMNENWNVVRDCKNDSFYYYYYYLFGEFDPRLAKHVHWFACDMTTESQTACDVTTKKVKCFIQYEVSKVLINEPFKIANHLFE